MSVCRDLVALALGVLLATILPTAGPAAAAGFSFAQILEPETSLGEFFGGSMAREGGTLVVGAPTADDFGTSSGAVYIYELGTDGWTQAARLTASDASARDLFGSSLSISGDTLVIAARRQRVAKNSRGAVYMFERIAGEWIEIRKLISPVAPGRERPFGSNVMVQGDRVAVQSAEGVDLFVRGEGDWQLEVSFADYGLASFDRRSLMLETFSGNSADDGPVILTFKPRPRGWVEKDTLAAPAGHCWWARAVSRAGKRLAITDPTDTSCPELQPGKIHIYRRVAGRWQEETQVVPTIPSSFGVAVEFFGFEVSIGERVLLARALDRTSQVQIGTVYVFERSGGEWLERIKIEPAVPRGEFGNTVLVGDDFFFVSSPGEQPGRVLVYRID